MTDANEHALTGKAARGGMASGRPVVVDGPRDLSHVKEGNILVAAETDIAYVPAMQRAAAIVTETGGRFCHAAVWARENDKPVLTQVEGATKALRDVALVTVDADAGRVVWTA